MRDYSIELCELLVKNNWAILTDDYVTTGGGRIDPKVYIIPVEVTDYLIQKINLESFNEQETNRAILLYTLKTIETEILNIYNEGKRRD